MIVKTNWKILVVEDDMDLYPDMERTLQAEAGRRNLHIQVLHAATFFAARQKLEAYRPDVVSTDMTYPLRERSHNCSTAGAILVELVTDTKPGTPCVVYSGNTVGQSMGILADICGEKFPPIFQKRFGTSHSMWARSTLDQLMRRI